MKKNDLILICSLLAIGIIFIASQYFLTNEDAEQVVVTVDGEDNKVLDLNKDTTYRIEMEDGEYNVLQIKGGEAKIIESNCKNQVCVQSKAISCVGETIVCLPHKVVIKIVSKNND